MTPPDATPGEGPPEWAAARPSTASTDRIGPRRRRLARGFRAQELRSLHDPLVLGGVVAALALPVLLLPLYPGTLAAPELDAVAAHIGGTLVQYLVLLSAVVAGIRAARAYATGRQGRDILLLGSIPAELCRITSAAILGGVLGVLTAGGPALAHLLRAGETLAHTLPPGETPLLAALGAGVAGGVWGDGIGRLVRAPLVVPLAVLATLSPAALLASVAPTLADMTPLGAIRAAVGVPLASDAGASAGSFAGMIAPAVALLWLLAAQAAALVVSRRRGVLP